VAAFVVWNVFRTDDATSRPHGAYFVFELLWRGVGYGTIDALLLTVFPCVVAYTMLHGRMTTVLRRARYVAIAVPMILVITATYHLGYPQYREDGVAKPEVGNTLISIPMLATANPVGSIAAHISMHVTAVTHSYETNVFLPPQTDS
jgi:general stress protein CsbA